MKINYSFEIYSFLGSKPDPKEIYSLVKHRYINTSFPCILSSTIANTLQVFLKHHNQISSLILKDFRAGKYFEDNQFSHYTKGKTGSEKEVTYPSSYS